MEKSSGRFVFGPLSTGSRNSHPRVETVFKFQRIKGLGAETGFSGQLRLFRISARLIPPILQNLGPALVLLLNEACASFSSFLTSPQFLFSEQD
jgi:hypothetical protein